MVSTDPISDMLTRIRNAIAVHKTEVVLPHSKLKETVAQELKRNRYVSQVSIDEANGRKQLRILINEPGTNARITEIQRISTPGRRAYAKADQIPRIKNGRGIVIVSTSQGVMNGTTAAQKRLGGELICRVY